MITGIHNSVSINDQYSKIVRFLITVYFTFFLGAMFDNIGDHVCVYISVMCSYQQLGVIG